MGSGVLSVGLVGGALLRSTMTPPSPSTMVGREAPYMKPVTRPSAAAGWGGASNFWGIRITQRKNGQDGFYRVFFYCSPKHGGGKEL